MNSDKKFKPIHNDVIFGRYNKSLRNGSIIKDKVIKQYSPIIIEIDETDYEDNMNGSIEPIIQEGDVIGLIHKCSCGKITEVHFDYHEVTDVDSDFQTPSDK